MANKTKTKKANGVGHNSKKEKKEKVTLTLTDKDLDKLTQARNDELKQFLRRAHNLIRDKRTAHRVHIKPIDKDLQELAKEADRKGFDKKYFKRLVKLEQVKLRDQEAREEEIEYGHFQNYVGYQPALPIAFPDE